MFQNPNFSLQNLSGSIKKKKKKEMENYSYSSYPDSHDSSPRSREIDCENGSWDEPPLPPSSTNYKVKFMCSYGGKIHPRPHDNQLAYVGGETKILAVDRNIRFSTIISKLSALCDYTDGVCFKYQLPGEDLDALISVTNDEDLEHMMLEYDRLHRSSKPARLRLFLLPPINTDNNSNNSSIDEQQGKPNQQWFVDALNSVPSIQSNLDSNSSSPPATASNPDFLFGLEKGSGLGVGVPVVGGAHHLVAPPPPPPPVVLDSSDQKQLPIGSDEPVVTPVDIQRQIHELQRLQIVSEQQQHQLQHHQQQQHHHQQQQQQHQQVMFQQRKNEDNLARAFAAGAGDYYMQKLPEKPLPPQMATSAPVASMPAPGVAAAYWQQQQHQQQQQDNRHMMSGGYPAPPPPSSGADQQVYLIPSPAGMYHHQIPTTNVRPVAGQVSQGYYGMQPQQQQQQLQQQQQRILPDVYRESPPPVYNMAQPQPQPQATKMMGGGMQLQMSMAETNTTGGGGGGAYAQVAYDSAGRQVYYATTAAPATMVPSSTPAAYQAVMAVDGRQSGPLNPPEGKVVVQSPSHKQQQQQSL